MTESIRAFLDPKNSEVSILRLQPRAAEGEEWSRRELLGMVCHDLCTPLNGLRGFLELLERTSLDENQRKCLETALTYMDDLQDLLEGLLECLRGESGQLPLRDEPCDIAGLLHAVIGFFRAQASSHGVGLSVHVSAEARGAWRIDRVKLRQILLNLLSNAVKFTRQGEISARVDAGTRNGSDAVLLFEVCDSGPGISRGQLSRVFDAFYQAGPNGSAGTGLGLVIVRKLVFAMGGEVEIRSAPGKGTLVLVELPAGRA